MAAIVMGCTCSGQVISLHFGTRVNSSGSQKTAGLHVGYGLVEVSNDVASLVVCTQRIFLGGAGFL